MKLREAIKCYDTLTGVYVEVPVTREVEEFIRRSYWREDMQERRYYQRVTEIDELHSSAEEVFSGRQSMLEDLIRKEECTYVAEQVQRLDTKRRQVVEMVYGRQLSVTEAANELGVSISYVSRLLKEARLKVAGFLEEGVR